MKIKDGFKLRKLGQQYVVVAFGEASKDFNGIVRLNGTGAFLFNQLEIGTDREKLIKSVTDKYEIDVENASNDVDAFIDKFQKTGLIDQ